METTQKWNKWFLLGIVAMVLAFGMLAVSCDDTTTTAEREDVNDTTTTAEWEDVTSLAQLNGTWKGSNSQTISLKDQSIEWTDELEAEYGDISVTTNGESTMIFDASASTMSGVMISTATYSGGNIAEIWADVKTIAEMLSSEDEDGTITVTANDTNHSITMKMNMNPMPISLDDLAAAYGGSLQINQNGTKLKMTVNSIETILIKQ
ncbi:hypothetical protein FACS1894172_20250 [Spirochaetia bacterium]|nr:hypothetical protein FACS1894164_16490 [Spirochaetia bacterium]GHU36987.1 hypothetical protein FACS1894172_20250 [Spirochaetia bacterium]